MLIGRARRERAFLAVWREHRTELLHDAVEGRPWSSLIAAEDVKTAMDEALDEAWRNKRALSGRSRQRAVLTGEVFSAPPLPERIVEESERAAEAFLGSKRRGFWKAVGAVGVLAVVLVAVAIVFRPDEGGAPSALVMCWGPGLVELDLDDSNDVGVPSQIERTVSGRGPVEACAELWRPGGPFGQPDATGVPDLELCDDDGSMVVVPGGPGECVVRGFDTDASPSDGGGLDQIAVLVGEEASDRCLTVEQLIAVAEELLSELGASDWTVQLQDTGPDTTDDAPDGPDSSSLPCALPFVDDGNKTITVIGPRD